MPRAPVDAGDGRPLLSTPVGTAIACAPPRRLSDAVLSTARDSEFLKTAPSPFAKRGVTPEDMSQDMSHVILFSYCKAVPVA